MKISRKSQIAFLVAALIVVGFIVYYEMKHPAPVIAPAPTGTTTPAVTDATWPSAQVSQKTINDSGAGYKITAVYPVTQNTADDLYFSSFVEDAVNSFKQDMATQGQPPANSATSVYTLDIQYKEDKNTTADNYVFSTNTDTGGAHGLQSTRTFSFTRTGQLITLADLFSNGLDGLKTIAPYIQKELNSHPNTDAQWVSEGAAASQENYQDFTVSSTGVTFIFDPYQVAPYSEGTISVLVPVSAFSSIANKSIFNTK